MGVLPVSLQSAPQGEVPRWDITLCLSREPQAEVPCMGNQPLSLQGNSTRRSPPWMGNQSVAQRAQRPQVGKRLSKGVRRLMSDALTSATTSYTVSVGILRAAVPPNKQTTLLTRL